MALSGGSTPRRLYEVLASDYRDELPWRRVHLFLGDERWVPPDHADSNFRMVAESLLDGLPIPAENVHPIRTDLPDPVEAAHQFDLVIDGYLGPLARPGFDLILLGIGDDGHTASLFAGSPALHARDLAAMAVQAPAHVPVKDRVTLTLPFINRSRHVIYLAAGEGKREILTQVLRDPDAAAARYPAAAARGMVTTEWFIDQAANPRFGF